MAKYIILLLWFQALSLMADSDFDEMPTMDMGGKKGGGQPGLLAAWSSSLQYRSFEEGNEQLGTFEVKGGGSLRSWARMQFQGELFHLSSHESPHQGGIHEAYLTLNYKSTDLSLGVQKNAWGVMDFVSPASSLSPQDFSRGVSPDFKRMDRGIPSVALRSSLSMLFLELLYRPVTMPHLLPGAKSPWDLASSVVGNLPGGGSYRGDRRYPGLGARFGAELGGINFRLSIYDGYEQFQLDQVPNLASAPGALSYNALDFDWALGIFVLKGEAAWGIRQRFVVGPLGGIESRDSRFSSGAIGFDLGYDALNFTMEYSTTGWDEDLVSLIPYLSERDVLSFSVKYSFLDEDLELSIAGQLGVDEYEELMMSRISYKLLPEVQLEGGHVDFKGDDTNLFGLYDQRDYVYGQVKFFL